MDKRESETAAPQKSAKATGYKAVRVTGTATYTVRFNELVLLPDQMTDEKAVEYVEWMFPDDECVIGDGDSNGLKPDLEDADYSCVTVKVVADSPEVREGKDPDDDGWGEPRIVGPGWLENLADAVIYPDAS